MLYFGLYIIPVNLHNMSARSGIVLDSAYTLFGFYILLLYCTLMDNVIEHVSAWIMNLVCWVLFNSCHKYWLSIQYHVFSDSYPLCSECQLTPAIMWSREIFVVIVLLYLNIAIVLLLLISLIPPESFIYPDC